jgi:chemotaxis protein methyltransferase CheR
MNAIPQDTLSRLRNLLASRTGLKHGEQDMTTLRDVVTARMASTGIADAAEYCQLLDTDEAASGDEWKELVGLLTIGESYFFRDAGQFELLRHLILPELIAARKPTRTLRLWSAGCSTGEEPYSLAILLDMLLPDVSEWDVSIIGTDVNRRAIQSARDGAFSEYSLRAMNDDLIKTRYFTHHNRRWLLSDSIRERVHFEYGNLVADSFPVYSTQLHDMDLIVCRNVFIYFDREAIGVVLPKLTNTLRVGGYLVTGHGELIGQNMGWLRARLYPESVVYQRVAPGEETRIPHIPRPPVPMPQLFPAPAPIPKPAPQPPAPVAPGQALHAQAEELFQAGAYAAAIEKARAAAALTPARFDTHYLMAQAYANLGDYDAARQCAQTAIGADRFAFGPYYLLAHVAELQGRAEEAKDFLNKVIYLEPSFTPAYLDIGALHEREGNAAKARRMRAVALDLLAKLPPDTLLAPYVELTAGKLRDYVTKLVGDQGKA